MLSGNGEAIDSGVRRKRNSRDFRYMDNGLLEVYLLLKIGEEDESGPEEGLEEFSRNISLEEPAELSQQEELQDLELHASKMI